MAQLYRDTRRNPRDTAALTIKAHFAASPGAGIDRRYEMPFP